MTRCLALALAISLAAMAASAQDPAARYEPVIKALQAGQANRARELAAAALLALGDDRGERRRAFDSLQTLAQAQLLINGSKQVSASELARAVKTVRAGLRFVDVPFLLMLARRCPAPLRPYVSHWLSAARRNGRQIGSVSDYLKARRIADPGLQREATAGLARLLAGLRKKVTDGGELTLAEQRLLSSRLLHQVLIQRLAEERDAPALDALPALGTALHSYSARASHALALIETPALVPLEAALKGGHKRAALGLKSVKAAISRRLREHPRSTWSSALGTLPRAGILRGYCGRCDLTLPASALHCSGCGEALADAVGERRQCPRCKLSVGKEESCQRCGGSAQAIPSKVVGCRVCRLSIDVQDRYCVHCGAPQREVAGKGKDKGK